MAEHQSMRRCAIYTRKSSEEGLEQNFNSLDAQREACAAFIASQKHEGWELIETQYDDGGYSGGTMERPALQQLLDDIGNGLVDVVVVYKADRLSRALSDFAKMVEIFDAQDVSFVSVTQQFNTTTSMGRLTLNVLLSFAQFEREVTGERIRDKFAASKKKGIWMGGNVPLGYDIVDRKLVVNEQEAEQVRQKFERYLALGCVRKLRQELTTQGYVSKRRTSARGNVTGGKPFSRGSLYALLQNPTYIGDIRHKDKRYPGEHEGIVDPEIWQRGQSLLNTNRVERKTGRNSTETSLLAGLLYDEYGRRLTPSHSQKGDRRYRYYVTPDGADDDYPPVRIPANDIEKIVTTEISRFLRDDQAILDTLDLPEDDLSARRYILDRINEKITVFTHGPSGEQKVAMIDFVQRIELHKSRIKVLIGPSRLRGWLTGDQIEIASERPVELDVEVAIRRRGAETKLIIKGNNGGPETKPDPALIKAIAKSRHWNDFIITGKAGSIRSLAKEEGVTHGYIRRILPLAQLAPSIVEDIIRGRQPVDLTQKCLIAANIPTTWDDQRLQLGFS